ncbi:DEAD/DEAH box helicase [Candidatus Bathyarchaeota archaeon]|nr:DEAD/DEAH box helicase [Candidatus Bathyarchaeota archaeon]
MGFNVFDLLAEEVRSILPKMGLLSPTEPQIRAIPPILRGENVLLIAPTGSGKTEAALLPVLSRFKHLPEKKGVSILYITPLRALNRDLVKRISLWADALGFTVEVRHGDTEMKARRKQALKPPNMLVTTPETLQAILPGKIMRGHLSSVLFVIIDEVHELADDKRGVQLAVALERLRELTGTEFQRVGLSATVGNPDEIAAFMAGFNRKVTIINVPIQKGYKYLVEYPAPNEGDYRLAEEIGINPDAAARLNYILEMIDKYRSTLIFVNSRTNAEMLGYRFSLLSPNISVHHGSLSREERTLIEDQFKSGLLKAIVCTSTLELGIDVGHVDLVIQYLSPRRVSNLIQRVGRSGHKISLTSEGIIVTAFTDDVLESIAAVRRAYENLIEPTIIHENSLDVLAHQIAGLVMDKGKIKVDEALNIIRRAYPYRSLSKVKFLEVVKYLEALREIHLEGDLMRRGERTRRYYYENLSMIPDERRYPVIDVISDRKIGDLGDEFMALRARIGLNFICKGKVWRIVEIEDETGTVYVVPSEDPLAAVPGWDGEMIPVPLSLALEVGRIRGEILKELRNEANIEKAISNIAEKLSVKSQVIREVVNEINEHIERKLPVPTDKNIIVEGFSRFLIIHTCFGEMINRALGCIFDAVLSDEGLIVGWWNDSYRILIELTREIRDQSLRQIAGKLFSLSNEEMEKAFQDYLKARFPFTSNIKIVAERFGALPRGRTMGPKELEKLPERFKDTPVYEEALKEALREKVDLESAKKFLREIKSGNVHLEILFSKERPSPMAYHILSVYSDLSELMAPKHVIMGNIERMKRTIEMRKVRLLCFSCLEWSTETNVKNVPNKPVCEICGSALITCIRNRQDLEELKQILNKRLKGEHLTENEIKNLSRARRTADLILSYGKQAIIALQVTGVGPETASRILGKMHMKEEDFYMDLLKAKIHFLRTRQYWEDQRSERLF